MATACAENSCPVNEVDSKCTTPPPERPAFLAADGVWFVCFVVTDITLSQAQVISRQSDLLVEWSVEQFHRAVERALNVTFPKAV